MTAIPNVVIFGETGAGKSSLVNLIAGKDIAPITSRAVKLTLQSTCYPVEVDGMCVNLHDTAGFDEDQERMDQDAVIQLYTLLRRLNIGVSLLIFCLRAPRIKESCIKNWRLFREVICQMRIPIVLAVTALEDQQPTMDDWWTQNENHFIKYNMYPNDVTCVTATRGRRRPDGSYRLDEEYRESQVKIRRSIRMAHLHHPWRVPPAEWLRDIVRHKTVLGSAAQELVTRCGMSMEEANALAQRLNGIIEQDVWEFE